MVNKLFFANTDPIQDDESCKWTQKGNVRNERGEGMLISAQDQSLRTTKVHQENIRHLRKMSYVTMRAEMRLFHISYNVVDLSCGML